MITLMDADRMPLPRFWYLPARREGRGRDERRRPLARQGSRRHRVRLRPLQGAEPGRLQRRPSGSASARPPTSIPTASLTNAQAAAYVAEGFEVGAPPGRRVVPDRADHRRRSSPPIFDAQLGACGGPVHEHPAPGHEPHPLRLLARLGVERRRSSSRTGSGWTRTTTTTPPAWIGAKPGFMNGGGFPMRFADADGTPIDVYQQNTNMTDESTTDVPAHDRRAARQRARAERATTARSAPTCTPTTRRTHPGAEAIVAAAQARGVPVISYKQMLDWVDGRDDSTIRGLNWSAGTLDVHDRRSARAPTGCRRCCPMQGPSGTLTAISSGGPPVPYTVADDQGHPVRGLRRRDRGVPGDVLLAGYVRPESWRRRSAVVPARREVDHVEPDRAHELGEVGELAAQRLIEPEDRPRVALHDTRRPRAACAAASACASSVTRLMSISRRAWARGLSSCEW